MLREEAQYKFQQINANTQFVYTMEFKDVALWQAFDNASGRDIDDHYKVPDDQQGLSYGTYKLELTSSTAFEYTNIKKTHHEFIYSLAGLEKMKQMIELWQYVLDIQIKMHSIGDRMIKSLDILYPCRFCRHLWK